MQLSAIGEFGLIAKLKKGLAVRKGVRLGIGDDAAILDSLQCPVVTMDALVEGVHFRRDWTTPRLLGRKAMAVNISDLAASGARPVAAFVSLAASQDDTLEWIEELYAGFEEMAQEFDFTVAGGDTVKSLGGTMISVALIGEALNLECGPILRSGAKAGDVLLVTGSLGDSAAGLAVLFEGKSTGHEIVLDRHSNPTPRLVPMKFLLEIEAKAIHAALDISDGLLGDAAHMALRSGVSIEIESERLPISNACRETAASLGYDPLHWALNGGEDYEILLAVSSGQVGRLVKSFEAEGSCSLTIIGCCVPVGVDGPKVALVGDGIREENFASWTHF